MKNLKPKPSEKNNLLNNYRKSALVRSLLAEGVDPLCCNKEGDTVIHLLCNDENKSYDRYLCKEICEKFPEIKSIRNEEGYTPYDLAKASKKYDLLYITGLFFFLINYNTLLNNVLNDNHISYS